MKRILSIAMLLVVIYSYAGGFRVSLQGVRQFAMAHTSAHVDDASITFFNPAGMSFVPDRLSFVLGGFGVSSKVEYQNLNNHTSEFTNNPLGTPVYTAATYKIVDRLSVGLSFTTPYGSTVQYDKGWTGKELVQRMSLHSMFFQPMISIKVNDWMSLGASYIYAKGSVDWNKAVTQLGGEVNIKDKKAYGHGFSTGAYFRPVENLDVSVSYRSQVDMKANRGVITFNDNIPTSVLSVINVDSSTKQDNFTSILPLIEEFTFGMSYRITPQWQVSYDLNVLGWSNYRELVLDFSTAEIGNTTDKTVLRNLKNFSGAEVHRVGIQRQINKHITGRVGYYSDQKVYKDDYFTPESPSFNLHVLTGGIGLSFGKFGVDVSGAYTISDHRVFKNIYTNFEGQSRMKAIVFGLGLSYNTF